MSVSEPTGIGGARQGTFVAGLCISLVIHALILALWPSLRQAVPAGQPLKLLATLQPPVIPPEKARIAETPLPRTRQGGDPGRFTPVVRSPEVESRPPPAAPLPAPVAVEPTSIAPPAVTSPPVRERLPASTPESRVSEVQLPPVANPVSRPSVGGTGLSAEMDSGSLEQYRLSLISAARRYRRYPPQAMERGWQGRVEVRLEISADGQPRNVSVRTSSGYPILDQQALDMITRGKTLALIPPNLKGREFTVDVPVIFDLRTN